jgi:hypothetical protein
VAAKTVARVAALAVMLAASGMAASAASGAATPSRPQATTLPQATTVRLVYACRFPSGTRQASVQISATFPARAVAGGPIQPTGVTLAVKLPPAGVADLVKRHASAVRASAELTLGVAQAGKSATVAWPGLEVPETTVPSAGSMALDASGAVPPIIVGGPGNVTVTAGSMLLALTLRTASDASTGPLRTAGGASPSPSPSPGRTVASPDVRIACTPVAGQVATLVTVAVAGAPGRAASSAPPAAPKCPKMPPGGYKQNKRFPLPKPPAGAVSISAPGEGCAYTGGYADVLKLNGAGLITPGEINLTVDANVDICSVGPHNPCKNSVNYAQFDSYGKLDYHGLPEFPPSTTTFLAFGFEPVSATLHLIEIGTINAVAIGPDLVGDPPCHDSLRLCPTVTTVSSYLYIRVTNVAINGVPLNVGADCGTAPFDAIVTGTNTSTPPYTVDNGGPVTGTIDIPPFTNCGVGEDMNPLFTASISGPDNVSLLTQGTVCFLQGGGYGCNTHTGKPVPPKTLLHSVVG